jgi:hypothetical protein
MATDPIPVRVESAAQQLAEWLARELPHGTSIYDPQWWAPRILRAVGFAELLRHGDEARREADAAHASERAHYEMAQRERERADAAEKARDEARERNIGYQRERDEAIAGHTAAEAQVRELRGCFVSTPSAAAPSRTLHHQDTATLSADRVSTVGGSV